MRNPYFNLVKTVWSEGKPWHFSIVGFYIVSALSQAIYNCGPYAFGRAIDLLQKFNPANLNQLLLWLSSGMVVVLLFWILHGPARYVERVIALHISQRYRANLYKEITHLPLKWHQDQHSGNLITRLNRATTALHTFAENQFIYIQAITRFVTSIGFLLWISLPIGLVSLFSSIFIFALILRFDRIIVPLYTAENEIDNRVSAVLFDYISNMTTVLTLRLGQLTHSNLWQRMQVMWPVLKREAVYNEVKWFIMMLGTATFQTVILMAYILHLVNSKQAILIGTVVMIFRYLYELGYVFFDLSVHYGELVKYNADIQGMNPILEDIAKLAHEPQGAATAEHWHSFRVDNLSFHHAPGEARGQIFDDVSFTINKGEKVALIGTSGGGKSTLLNLLSSLYQPSKVQLTIDDQRFDSLEPLQAITTLIPQDPEIFENTILFNIALDLPVEETEILESVKLSGFAPVLATLPEGLNTDIREKGLNFSVGQKQRLALARGLFAARFSSLILMDEPTSSVDLPTEKEILLNVIQSYPDAAMIISLHRLHLLPNFDKVIMLDKGKVVACGPVAELLQTPGPVHELWESYLADFEISN